MIQSSHQPSIWKRRLFIAPIFLFLGFVSCTGGGPRENILNRGNGTEVKDVDPHIVTGVPEHHIIVAISEGLVSVDPKTVEPRDGVAILPPKISNNGKTYVFNLRKDAKWSNGEPLTAHDFVYSWRRLLNPTTGSQYADMAYPVKNAEAINKGEIKDLTKLGVEAIDDHTLKVELENPTPYFLGMLYHYTMYPVPQKVIEKHGAQWTKPENFVGNGPFVLTEWVLNKVLRTRRNPNYWDKANVKLDGVDFWPIENQSTEEKMFRAGKLDVTYEVPIERIPFWQKDDSGVYFQPAYLGTYFYRLNTTRKPLNDKRVRKALALGIDRERIIEFVTKGGELPARAFTPPGTGGYTPKVYLPQASEGIAEAKKLLAEAGFPEGKGFPSMEILYNTSENHKKIALAIQEMWKENLGINVKLFNQEWKVYLARQQKIDYDICRAGWIGDYSDPHTFLDMWVTDRGNNETGWSNKQYDNLIAQAASSGDLEKRKEYFAKAEDLLLEDMPVIPIYIYTRKFLKKPEVKGWFPNIQDYHPLKHVYLDLK